MRNELSPKSKRVWIVQGCAVLFDLVLLVMIYRLYGTYGDKADRVDNCFRLGASVASSFTLLLLQILTWLDQKASRQMNLFFSLCFFIGLDLLCSSAAWLSVQPGISVQVMRLLLACTFFPGPLLSMVFWEYQRCVYRVEKTEWLRLNRLVHIVGAVNLLVALLAPFFSYYFTVAEDGTYHRGSSYFLCYVYPMLLLLLSAVSVWRRRGGSRRQKVALLCFSLAPIFMSAIALVTGRMSFIHAGDAVLALLLYSTIQTERSLALAKADEELAEAKLSMALQQINPHFIYNTLGSIDSLCSVDLAAGQTLLRRFSKYLRMNYRNMVSQPLVPIAEELDRLETYLSIERVRFPNLTVVTDIEIRDSFMLPPLTLQPLVENAIEHGICRRKKSRGTVTVQIRETEEEYRITVSDDGVGFSGEVPQDGRPHIGIDNVTKRLQMLCGGTLTVESTVHVGTVCTVTIPKKSGGGVL